MLSLFRRIVCYVIAMQMALTPLYGASAALPVVMVSDTKAQILLTSQVIALANLNIKLLELNNAQTATNETLTKILGAIKYIPDPKIKGPVPTTDAILMEFSTSLYAAYTGDYSIATAPMRDNTTGAFTDTPRVGPTNPTSSSTNTSSPADYLSPTTDSLTQTPTKAPNALDKANNAMKGAMEFAGKVQGFARDVQGVQNSLTSMRQCGNINNLASCAQSAGNIIGGIPKILGQLGLDMNFLGANFSQTITGITTTIGMVGSLINTFSGGISGEKIASIIQQTSALLNATGLSKGASPLPPELIAGLRGVNGFLYNVTALFGPLANVSTTLGGSDAFTPLGSAISKTGVPAALDAIASLGPRDTPKTGSLSTDTPLAGTSNPPQALTPTDMETILLGFLDCNRNVAKTTAECAMMIGQNKRLIQGHLKARCAAMAMNQQVGPAAMFQELFTGTGNPERCDKTVMYKGKKLCPSIFALQATSNVEGAVGSQLNVLIGLSMYNLVMTNVNTEQVILQNACASMGDLLESGAPVYRAND
jgi:hypothetical protein